MVDVTEFRELQERVGHSEQLAAIGELSAAIAHEIRNPLGAINTSVVILQKGLQVDGENKEVMDIICEETKRLDRIIGDFLQFARLDKSRFEKTDVNYLLQETLILFRVEFGTQIQGKAKLSQNIPLIMADPSQLKQVFIFMTQVYIVKL